MASERFATIPELVGMVFNTLIPAYHKTCADTSDLVRWTRVNRIWLSEGRRILWKSAHIIAQHDIRPNSAPDLSILNQNGVQEVSKSIKHLQLGINPDSEKEEDPSIDDVESYRRIANQVNLNLHSLQVRGNSNIQYLWIQNVSELKRYFGISLSTLKLHGELIRPGLLDYIKQHTEGLTTLHLEFTRPPKEMALNALLQILKDKNLLQDVRITGKDFTLDKQIFYAMAQHSNIHTAHDLVAPDGLSPHLAQSLQQIFFPQLKRLNVKGTPPIELATKLSSLTHLTLRGIAMTPELLAILGYSNAGTQGFQPLPCLECLVLKFINDRWDSETSLVKALLALTFLKRLVISVWEEMFLSGDLRRQMSLQLHARRADQRRTLMEIDMSFGTSVYRGHIRSERVVKYRKVMGVLFKVEDTVIEVSKYFNQYFW